MTFWVAVVAQAVFFAASGFWLGRGVERDRHDERLGGYMPVTEASAPPYDWAGTFPKAPAVSDEGAA